MKKIWFLVVLMCGMISVASVRATTVIPPTFDDLVDQAEFIFDGTVTNVKSEWVGEGAERHIMTYVSFRVEESLKGKMEQTYTIRMLGGTVDGKTMAVSDAPKFKSGDRDILFVQNNGTQFVPLVGIMHGRFRVAHDQSGYEMITTNEGQPLKNVARLGRSETASADEPTLTPASFKAAIQNRLRNAP